MARSNSMKKQLSTFTNKSSNKEKIMDYEAAYTLQENSNDKQLVFHLFSNKIFFINKYRYSPSKNSTYNDQRINQDFIELFEGNKNMANKIL
jgi:hypothetical protein